MAESEKNPIGRPKAIESPEKMWELFLKYKEYTKANPIEVQDFVGKDATEVWRQKERPLTMEGFECFVADIDGMPWSLDHYFANREERYTDFVSICSRIRREIRNHQIAGGLAGIYNPSITQRLNGLVDKSEVSGTTTVVKIVRHHSDTRNEPIK